MNLGCAGVEYPDLNVNLSASLDQHGYANEKSWAEFSDHDEHNSIRSGFSGRSQA